MQIAKIYCNYYTLTVKIGWESYHAKNKLKDSWFIVDFTLWLETVLETMF